MEEYEYRWIGTDEDLINNGFKLEIDYEIYATKDNSWSFCVDRDCLRVKYKTPKHLEQIEELLKKGVIKRYRIRPKSNK